MNKNVALTAASGMMGGLNLTELDEMSKSALSELTNMIWAIPPHFFITEGLALK